MKPTDAEKEKPFGQLPLVTARTFELPAPHALSPAHADEWVNHMRAQPHLVVRRFWRTVKAGGAAIGLLVVVVRRKDGL